MWIIFFRIRESACLLYTSNSFWRIGLALYPDLRYTEFQSQISPDRRNCSDRKMCIRDRFHTTIVVVNNEELSPQEELVQDIVSILHVFSCRLYGLRKYKKQIEGDEEIAKELQNGNKSDSRAKNQD